MRAQGLFRAREDRRCHVLLDLKVEVYSRSQLSSAKVKAFKSLLGIPKDPPPVEEQRAWLLEKTKNRLKGHAKMLEARQRKKGFVLEFQHRLMVERHRKRRSVLNERHTERSQSEQRERGGPIAARIKGGLKLDCGRIDERAASKRD